MTTIKSIEEKARRYDKALERANKLKETCDSNAVVGWMEYIFPELKESVDIRKRIIDALHGDVLETSEIKEAVAWLEKQGNNMGISEATKQKLEDNLNKALEKETQESCNKFLDEQGEQKPTVEMKTPEESLGVDSDTYNKIVDECVYGEQKPVVILKFRVGDTIKNKKTNKIFTISDYSLLYEYYHDINHYHEIKFSEQDDWELVEQPAWSEEDEKQARQIERIVSNDGCTKKLQEQIHNWFESLKDRVQPKQEWKQENTGDLTDFENAMMHIGGSFFGENAGLDPNDTKAIKEQANFLLELVPSKDWSEEDEEMIDSIIGNIKYLYSIGSCDNATVDMKVNWLKSLSPQSQWKPSDEQMEELHNVFNDTSAGWDDNVIESLYNDLKKLKG